ncbi:MAG: prolyl oligopeptidase family serine peptidase [Mucilaginibacter sp.]
MPIDPRKIYVIGFSMGASTAINAMGQRPDLFAAAVSISGIPEFDQLDVIALKPIWFIHGDADTENPIASDALFYKKLQEQKARNIRYWQVEGLQHEIYPELYMTDEIPKWLWRN